MKPALPAESSQGRVGCHFTLYALSLRCRVCKPMPNTRAAWLLLPPTAS